MTWSSPLSQPCRTGQHRHCGDPTCQCPHHASGTGDGYLHCPLRDCSWRTVDRSHLGTVMVVSSEDADDYLTGTGCRMPRLQTVPAREQMHGELLAHLADEHLAELQLMLAGASGGHGQPVVAFVHYSLDARSLQDAADVVLAVVVPKLRAQLAAELARKNLRPVDPWPAVQVRRYCWGKYLEAHPELAAAEDAPAGMRPAGEDEQPDLYQLELRTDAVPDTRTVKL